jgi:hypothetical protein
MKKKDYIFCLLSNNSNSIKIFNIYKNYIESVINRYGKFVIVDFYRYSQKNNKKIINEKLLKKKFKNEIHFFYPKNKYEFYDFIRNKQVFALDSLSRDFKDFKIRYLINKKNIFIILLANIGNISNEKNGTLDLSLRNKFYSYYKILNKYIYRILILLDIFPKTFLYFDSRKKIVDKFNNSKFRKMFKKFPKLGFLINYLNVHRINSNSYENFIKLKKREKNNKIIFIDGNYEHPDILKKEQLDLHKVKIEYFKLLSKKFTILEKIFKKKIEICLHPSSDLKVYKKNLQKFRISKGKTIEKVYDSYMIIFHESSAVMDALIAKKKILILETNILGNYLLNKMLMYKNLIKLPSIDMHSTKILSKKDILNEYSKTKKHRDQYIKDNLIYHNNELPSITFMNVINNLIKKNQRVS